MLPPSVALSRWDRRKQAMRARWQPGRALRARGRSSRVHAVRLAVLAAGVVVAACGGLSKAAPEAAPLPRSGVTWVRDAAPLRKGMAEEALVWDDDENGEDGDTHEEAVSHTAAQPSPPRRRWTLTSRSIAVWPPVYHLHVPKTGGASFWSDWRRLVSGKSALTVNGGRRVPRLGGSCNLTPLGPPPDDQLWGKEGIESMSACAYFTHEAALGAAPPGREADVNAVTGTAAVRLALGDGRARIYTLVRDPLSHVESQWGHCYRKNHNRAMECARLDREAAQELGGNSTPIVPCGRQNGGIPATAAEWVMRWRDVKRSEEANHKTPPDLYRVDGVGLNAHDPTGSHCYRPIDMQTLRFGIEVGAAVAPTSDGADALARMGEDDDSATAAANEGAEALRRAGFVIGLLDEYPRSLCLLTLEAFGVLLDACNCTGRNVRAQQPSERVRRALFRARWMCVLQVSLTRMEGRCAHTHSHTMVTAVELRLAHQARGVRGRRRGGARIGSGRAPRSAPP